MKKLGVLLVLSFVFLTGCKDKTNEKIDYSNYDFTEISWVRDGGHDIETIKFRADGSFSYSCACGNPVNDADMCEKYTYNNETKEIKLECFDTTKETITTIKLINVTDDSLELDFAGERRIFSKDK